MLNSRKNLAALAVIGVVVVFIFIFVLGLMGSQTGAVFESVSSSLEGEMASEEALAPMAAARDDFAYDADGLNNVATQPQQGAGVANQVQERLIIRTAELSIIVSDTEESIRMIGGLANSTGGWVVSSGTYQYSEAKRGNMSIRVPAEKFEAILQQIKDSAVEVTSENVSGQDVTEEYVDLSARLENLEATAARVRGFLDDTESVEEALAVNMELSRLEGDIEAMKGRLQYLSQSAAFSTININLTPDILNQPIEVAGWRPQGIAREAIEALIETLQVVANIGIWIVLYILPLGILIVLPLYFIGRWFFRRRKQRRQTAASS